MLYLLEAAQQLEHCLNAAANTRCRAHTARSSPFQGDPLFIQLGLAPVTEEEAPHSVFTETPPYSKRPKITGLSARFLLLWCNRGFSQELAELVPQTRSSMMLVKQEGVGGWGERVFCYPAQG